MEAYRQRRERLVGYMAEKGISALILEDFENLRSQSLRYLCGHPADAILFLFADGKSLLVPWDVTMAREKADVGSVVPYSDFNRSFKEAAAAVLADNLGVEAGGKATVEVSGRTTHPRYLELCSRLPDFRILCDEAGVNAFISGLRTVKDPDETAALRKAAGITNELARRVERIVSSGPAGSPTEIELAQLIEREALGLGAEGLGFETLAAGPLRSWAIHAFPPYTSGPFGGRGLSILDFGVKVDGYTSDVTLTIARGPLSAEQERMLSLVERAYAEAMKTSTRGASPLDPARAADAAFAAEGWKMPHALGHGIGLDAHERPLLRAQGELSDPELLPGMAFTIEPGLYNPEHGGVRLENDVLMTESGPEILTEARIIRL
jgi:Xaa-Pro dipeptidase